MFYANSNRRRKEGSCFLITQVKSRSFFCLLIRCVKTTSPRILNSGAQGRGWEGVQGLFIEVVNGWTVTAVGFVKRSNPSSLSLECFSQKTLSKLTSNL